MNTYQTKLAALQMYEDALETMSYAQDVYANADYVEKVAADSLTDTPYGQIAAGTAASQIPFVGVIAGPSLTEYMAKNRAYEHGIENYGNVGTPFAHRHPIATNFGASLGGAIAGGALGYGVGALISPKLMRGKGNLIPDAIRSRLGGSALGSTLGSIVASAYANSQIADLSHYAPTEE